MPNIKITVDSTCDLSPEIMEKYDISVLPLYTVLGDNAYRDGIEATPDDIYKYVSETGSLPQTSAGAIDDYLTFFKKYVDEGFEVIHFSVSSCMSSSHQNALIAAGELENVYVVDTQNLSTGSGLLAMDAVDMRAEGLSAAEIHEKLKARTPLVRASFVVDNLDYLKKGGRCSAVVALGANLLKIKPRIDVKDGKMGMGDKYRGQYNKVMLTYVKDVLSKEKINTKRVFVTHTKADPELIEAIKNEVKSLVDFEEMYETIAGCVITSHCGPNTIGVLFEVE
ncbi:MAG: DegV family protein [Clostridia bacterium]|nr:DegV family protein [Clostridia bacterium]